MTKLNLNLCATDKEIYDILMSSKLKLSENTLRNIIKDRGIFYSKYNDREVLSDLISILPHDSHDLNSLMDKAESNQRMEKNTSISLSPVPISDIKDIASNYRDSISDENVIIQQTKDELTMKIEYSEIDYSRTRLIQRKIKEAEIKFIKHDNKIVVRMPPTEKARSVFDIIKKELTEKHNIPIIYEDINLENITNTDLRTKFFTHLISRLKQFNLVSVTSLKVESNKYQEEQDLDFEDDPEIEEAKSKMLVLVRNVALKGENLLISPEYQQLKTKGFYITSITWKSKQENAPYSIFEFEAGFEDPISCKNLKYIVRGQYTVNNNEYVKNIKSISNSDKLNLLSIIEETASIAFNLVKEENAIQIHQNS